MTKKNDQLFAIDGMFDTKSIFFKGFYRFPKYISPRDDAKTWSDIKELLSAFQISYSHRVPVEGKMSEYYQTEQLIRAAEYDIHSDDGSILAVIYDTIQKIISEKGTKELYVRVAPEIEVRTTPNGEQIKTVYMRLQYVDNAVIERDEELVS